MLGSVFCFRSRQPAILVLFGALFPCISTVSSSFRPQNRTSMIFTFYTHTHWTYTSRHVSVSTSTCSAIHTASSLAPNAFTSYRPAPPAIQFVSFIHVAGAFLGIRFSLAIVGEIENGRRGRNMTVYQEWVSFRAMLCFGCAEKPCPSARLNIQVCPCPGSCSVRLFPAHLRAYNHVSCLGVQGSCRFRTTTRF